MVGATKHRVLCCVPFCGRWRHGEPGGDWICWEHFKRIPLPRRRAYFRAVAERAPEWLEAERRMPRWMLPRPLRSRKGERSRSIRALYRLFDALKRTAIERAL